MSEPEQASLLKGVRVLDLSQYIPGPYASLQLAQLGAKVIKVEAPGGDPMRSFGVNRGEISSFYQHLNRGKKIVEINLKRKEGLATFKALLSNANILLEGFRPGTLQRLGIDTEFIAETNPGLIVCSLSGFGSDGPGAQRGGHDLGYGACAGLYSGQSAKPSVIFPPVADHVGALQALTTMLAALYRQQKTGLGCSLDMSLVEPVLAWQYLAEDDADSRLLCGDAAYYNIYPTADNRFVTLAALEAKFWSAFCTALNKTEWIERQTDAMPQSSLKAELGLLFSSQPLSHWQLRLDGVDCCFEPIPLEAEAGLSHQARARGLKNHFPGKIDGRNTPTLGDFEFVEPEEINWTYE